MSHDPATLTERELAEARHMLDMKPQLQLCLGRGDKALEEFALILRAYRATVSALGKAE